MIKMKSKAHNTPHSGWADLVQNKSKEKMSPNMNHLLLCPHPYSWRDASVLYKRTYCLIHQRNVHKHQCFENLRVNICLHNSIKIKWHPIKVHQENAQSLKNTLPNNAVIEATTKEPQIHSLPDTHWDDGSSVQGPVFPEKTTQNKSRYNHTTTPTST